MVSGADYWWQVVSAKKERPSEWDSGADLFFAGLIENSRIGW
jgi:hypothetical protein